MPSGKRAHLFASRSDLLLVLSALEEKRQIKYVQGEMLLHPDRQTWARAIELPNLGQAKSEQLVGCEEYLLMDVEVPIMVTSTIMNNGVRRFDADNGSNPDAVRFLAGGFFQDETLICSLFDSFASTMKSKSLMSWIQQFLRKNFTRVGAFWVGPEALVELKGGRRLTMAVQSPQEYDLRIPG